MPFSRSALVISRGSSAGGRRVSYGLSPCAPRVLRLEVAMSRLVPPHVQANLPPDAEEIVPTLYDPEEFAALYHADKDRALALLAAMSEPQCVRQALAYAAWLPTTVWRSIWRPC